jgi:hypothetical protein
MERRISTTQKKEKFPRQRIVGLKTSVSVPAKASTTRW